MAGAFPQPMSQPETIRRSRTMGHGRSAGSPCALGLLLRLQLLCWVPLHLDALDFPGPPTQEPAIPVPTPPDRARAWELTYGGGGPPLPACLQPLWDDSRRAASLWLDQHHLPGEALAATRELSLTAVSIRIPHDSDPDEDIPALAGWWSAAQAGNPEFQRLVASWRGYHLTASGSAAQLVQPGLAEPVPGPLPPGWRVVLHGPFLSQYLSRALSGDALQIGIDQWLQDWELTATTDGPTHATLDLGQPAPWLRPIDAGATIHRPHGAHLSVAVGIDATAVAASLAPLLSQDAMTLLRGDQPMPLAMLAPAFTGTWTFSMVQDQGWVLIAPPSQLMAQVLLRIAPQLAKAMPDGKITEDAGDGILLSRSRLGWAFASDAKLLEGIWQREEPPLPDQGVLAAEIQPDCLSDLLKVFPGMYGELPLTDSSAETMAAMNGDDVGVDHAFMQRLGTQRLVLRQDHARLQGAWSGTVLPWLLPGLLLRWFGDQALAQDAEHRALGQLNRWRQQGSGTTMQQLSLLLPHRPLQARLARWHEWLNRWASTAMTSAVMQEIAQEGLPVIANPMISQELPQLDRLLGESAAMLAGGPIDQGDCLCDAVVAPPPWNEVLAQSIAKFDDAAVELAGLGDRRCIDLVRRLDRISEHPLNVDQLGCWTMAQAMRDWTYLLAVATDAVDDQDRERWLQEADPQPDLARVLEGMRIQLCANLNEWLSYQPPLAAGIQPGLPDAFRWPSLMPDAHPGFFLDHVSRAESVDKLLALACQVQAESAAERASGPGPITAAGLGAGSLGAARCLMLDLRCQRQLARMAARLLVSCRTSGSPCLSQEEAASRIGPLRLDSGRWDLAAGALSPAAWRIPAERGHDGVVSRRRAQPVVAGGHLWRPILAAAGLDRPASAADRWVQEWYFPRLLAVHVHPCAGSPPCDQQPQPPARPLTQARGRRHRQSL